MSPSRRYWLEDLLWEEDAPPEMPKKARRELARALDLSELAQHHDRFMRLLERFWIAEDSGLSFAELEGLLSNGVRPVTLRDRIERYVFRNPGDWSTEDLFDNRGAFEAGDARLARFLEDLVSADVLLDEHLQEKTASTINGHLQAAGVELSLFFFFRLRTMSRTGSLTWGFAGHGDGLRLITCIPWSCWAARGALRKRSGIGVTDPRTAAAGAGGARSKDATNSRRP